MNNTLIKIFDYDYCEDKVITMAGSRYVELSAIGLQNANFEISNGVIYSDIVYYYEFQKLHVPPNWYWCEFYGGEKEYRCILVPASAKRAEILNNREITKLLDDSIDPVYSDKSVVCRQDPSHAMPCFYIVAPSKGFISTDSLGLAQYMRMRGVEYTVGKFIRAKTGIDRLYKVNEERGVSYQNVHTWLLPVRDSKDIYELDTLKYMMKNSGWRENKNQIIQLNSELKCYIKNELTSKYLNSIEDIVDEVLPENMLVDMINTCRDIRNGNIRGKILAEEDKEIKNLLYCNDGVIVKLVSQFSSLGRVTITLDENFTSKRQKKILFLRVRFIEYVLRVIMREGLGLNYVYKLYDEYHKAYKKSTLTLLPINNIEKYNRIYNFIIADYINENEIEVDNDQIYMDAKFFRIIINSLDLKKFDMHLNKSLKELEILG